MIEPIAAVRWPPATLPVVFATEFIADRETEDNVA